MIHLQFELFMLQAPVSLRWRPSYEGLCWRNTSHCGPS